MKKLALLFLVCSLKAMEQDPAQPLLASSVAARVLGSAVTAQPNSQSMSTSAKRGCCNLTRKQACCCCARSAVGAGALAISGFSVLVLAPNVTFDAVMKVGLSAALIGSACSPLTELAAFKLAYMSDEDYVQKSASWSAWASSKCLCK